MPLSQSAGLPRLTARLNERGSNKSADVIVTNHGPGIVYELVAEPTNDDDLLRVSDELPVPQLPVGKSVRMLQRMAPALSQVVRSCFTVRLRGRTADGVPIEQDEFVSGD